MNRSTLLVAIAISIASPASLAARNPPVEQHRQFSSYVQPSAADLLAVQPSELAAFINRFRQDRAALDRFYTIAFSPTRLHKHRELYESWLNTLNGMNVDSLSTDGRLDWLLLRNLLERELEELDVLERRVAETQPLIPFAHVIIDLAEARQRIDPIDPAEAARTLHDLATHITETHDAWRDRQKTGEDLPKPTVANRGAGYVGDLRRALREWDSFYDGYHPLFTWWMQQPYAAVNEALTRYSDFLRDELVGVDPDDENAIIGDPLGHDALMTALQYELIPYTPEELIEIARREFEWCDREMLRASNDLGYGDDWHAAMEYVKTLHVTPGEQPNMIRDLALEAIDFLEARNLVGIPQLANDIWRMDMMSPQRQLVTPFFTGGEVISVSFPTEGMTQEQKFMSMRANNLHFSRATVHHELIPGHHLQMFMNDRYRVHRQVFDTPFWLEGWALYWEMLLWDHGFQQSAEDRVGALFWRMHRCARIIFSLSFHLELMTPQECIDFLVERVGHERDSATAEVRRSFGGGYPPLYQAAYMLGGLQFRALHKELVQSGRMTDAEFHDAILRENSIPIALLREKLLGNDLTRETRPTWRFAD